MSIKALNFIGKVSFGLVAMVIFVSGFELYGMRLSEISCSAGSVLPFFIDEKGDKCVILGQETGGCDKGKYDDFGGTMESCDKHPVVTAAREFWEEAILEHTIGMSQSDVRNYIDQTNNNTETIIAFKTKRKPYHYMVTYVTDFTPYAHIFLDNFYKVRFGQKLQLRREFNEKNSIAIVKWGNLKNAIASTDFGDVTVYAMVLGKNGEKMNQEIPLRRIFSSKMRLFFQDKAYQVGSLEKIHFYSYDFVEAQQCHETD